MSKINDMRIKRGEIWDKAKKFLDDHQNESGLMSAEDTATYERMEQEVVDLGHAIEREERAAEMERELNAATNTPLTSRPEKAVTGKQGRASDEYKNAFWRMVRNRGGHLLVQNALQIGEDSEGGYLCPDEYERTLVKALEEENRLRSLCTIIRTESGDRKIPIVASHGTASWVDEEGVIPESDDVFGQISLGAHKLATMIKVSDELLQDSVFDIESYIAAEFARRIGAAEEDAFINGDGSGKPYGLLHTTNGAGIGITTAGATFTSDEILDLIHSVKAGYRKNAKFLLNDSSIKALRKLKDGNGQYMWQPGLKEGQPDRLLSHELITSAYMPEIGAGAKPILFGDFKSYWIADRQGRTFQRLNELYAATGQVGFRATQRVDGRLVQTEGLKCLQIKGA
ncbi:MAG: phage major capsid protein [Clostridiales bacterium]|nr:phage major capsid protein [Clostridiales bacterium]MBE5809641.1 phage major capsid protein [Clostridiales bacterium]